MIDHTHDAAGGTTQRTTEKAQDTLHRAEERAREVGEQVRHRASDVQHKVSEKGHETFENLSTKTSELVQNQVEQRKHVFAEEISAFSQALRHSAQEMRAQGQSNNTQYMERVADRVESLSTYLETHEPRELLATTERFARDHQAAFLGGAFALGVIGARFLKSSSTPQRISYESEERWGYEDPTSRVYEPQDAIRRPDAPGYQDPSRDRVMDDTFNRENTGGSQIL